MDRSIIEIKKEGIAQFKAKWVAQTKTIYRYSYGISLGDTLPYLFQIAVAQSTTEIPACRRSALTFGFNPLLIARAIR